MAVKCFARVDCDGCGKESDYVPLTRDDLQDVFDLSNARPTPAGWIAIGGNRTVTQGGARHTIRSSLYLFCSPGCVEEGKKKAIDEATERARNAVHAFWYPAEAK